MVDGNDPPVRLIDLILFAPVGLAALVQRELPQLVASGRTRVDNRIQLAKFVGRMAVRQTSNEFNRRMQNLEQARAAAVAHPGVITVRSTESDAPPIGDTNLNNPKSASVALAIEDYDALAASHVVQRLSSLSTTQLDHVRTYEQANRARRTILGKIAQLQAP